MWQVALFPRLISHPALCPRCTCSLCTVHDSAPPLRGALSPYSYTPLAPRAQCWPVYGFSRAFRVRPPAPQPLIVHTEIGMPEPRAQTLICRLFGALRYSRYTSPSHRPVPPVPLAARKVCTMLRSEAAYSVYTHAYVGFMFYHGLHTCIYMCTIKVSVTGLYSIHTWTRNAPYALPAPWSLLCASWREARPGHTAQTHK